MRVFYLYRKEDPTGVSGTGFVAEGVVFHSKKAIIHWRTGKDSMALYEDMTTLCAVHCHGGKTQVIWDDEDWINEKGEPMLFYCEGMSNLVTNELDGHYSSEEANKAGWLRPCAYAEKHLDPRLDEARYTKKLDEVRKYIPIVIGEDMERKRRDSGDLKRHKALVRK